MNEQKWIFWDEAPRMTWNFKMDRIYNLLDNSEFEDWIRDEEWFASTQKNNVLLRRLNDYWRGQKQNLILNIHGKKRNGMSYVGIQLAKNIEKELDVKYDFVFTFDEFMKKLENIDNETIEAK
jgi:hypothetical protein